MADPKTPPPSTIPKKTDAGFPPINDNDDPADPEGDAADDPAADFHEEGGGD